MNPLTLLVLFSVFLMFVFIFMLFSTANPHHKYVNKPDFNNNNYKIPASCSR